MSMVGADVDALRRLAGSLRHTMHEVEAARLEVAAVVGGLRWAGDDRDRFVDEWHRVHDPTLMTIASEMGRASAQAGQHAARQEWASRRHP